MFVEVIYGLLSNSLGLLTDGAHMLLDCTAVVIGLYSSYLSEFKSNNNYNYGYLRSEILGTFINSVFLFFIAIYIVFESIERFIEPKEIDSENLILVSFIGLVVTMDMRMNINMTMSMSTIMSIRIKIMKNLSMNMIMKSMKKSMDIMSIKMRIFMQYIFIF